MNKPEVESLSAGLIHHTFRATESSRSFIIQKINTGIFTQPQHLIKNYLTLWHHLSKKHLFLPEAICTANNDYCFYDSTGGVWRALVYVPQTFTLTTNMQADDAEKAAACFARYGAALSDLPVGVLMPSIPEFHNLKFRYLKFEEACRQDRCSRRKNIDDLVADLQHRMYYIQFFEQVQHNSEFALRIMHCDCKTGNLLFSQTTRQPVCPVDWDTAMPGYFFSDVGDLIRSAVATLPESDAHVNRMEIRKELYHAILRGYTRHARFTLTENKHIHHAGLLMAYMQALRFITDYLNGDVYYQTAYPDQNLHRGLNQLALLKKLESFLEQELKYNIYT